MRLTITEALAEIETIGKRITARRELCAAYSEGGFDERIPPEVQSILELERRHIELRLAILRAYDQTRMALDAGGYTIERTVAEWMIWRDEIVPAAQAHNTDIMRRAALTGRPRMIALMQDAEIMGRLLDALYVQLYFTHATVQIEVEGRDRT